MKAILDAVGIDLGTNSSKCAYVRADKNNSPVIISNRWGRTSTPSIVGWDGGWAVGEDAARLFLSGSGPVWRDIKRQIGNENFTVVCDGTRYMTHDVLTPLLRALREDAEVFLGRFVSSCALAVPANFSTLQREVMTRAAEAAGMTNVRLIDEPVAAALAFGREGRFLILDFGAITSDISIVENEGGMWRILESVENSEIGGRDFDIALAEWLRERLKLGNTPEGNPCWRALLLEAEAIKIALSSCLTYDWKPPSLDCREFPVVTIECEELERVTRFSIRRLLNMVRRLWEKHLPERLLLVGGSSRIPLVREIIEREIVGPERLTVCADESIAIGAALYAARQECPSPDAVSGGDDHVDSSASDRRTRDLKMRLVPVENALTVAQKIRLHTMFDKLENLKDDVSAEILEGVVKDLEAELLSN